MIFVIKKSFLYSWSNIIVDQLSRPFMFCMSKSVICCALPPTLIANFDLNGSFERITQLISASGKKLARQITGSQRINRTICLTQISPLYLNRLLLKKISLFMMFYVVKLHVTHGILARIIVIGVQFSYDLPNTYFKRIYIEI